MQGIYQIRNITTNKIYIGSSKDLNRRWRAHKRLLIRNEHHSIILQRSWNKHTESAFIFETLEIVDDIQQLLQREEHWFNTLKPKYNVCPTPGSSLGWKHTEATKQKLREMNLGEKNPHYRINKIDKPKINKPSKIILQIDVNTCEIISEYLSIAKAAETFNTIKSKDRLVIHKSIYNALTGRAKLCRGFLWKFKDIS